MMESVKNQGKLPAEKLCERLHEQISDWHGEQSTVDRDQMQVLSIALAGPNSRNGYQYTEESLRDALPLYENRPVFLDHAANASRPHERSTRDLVGSIMNVRFEQGRIRGDIQVLDTESGRTFLALAEKKTQFVGMSHVVLARRSADKTKVEKIEEVISVDAVVFPATTSTFQEQVSDTQSESIPNSFEAAVVAVDAAILESAVLQQQGWNTRVAIFDDVVVMGNAEQLDDPSYAVVSWSWKTDGLIELSDIVETVNWSQLIDGSWREGLDSSTGEDAIENELAGASESVIDTELQAVRDQLISERTRYDQLMKKHEKFRKRQKKEAHIEQLITESQIPKKAVTQEFRTVLYEAKNDQLRKSILRDRRWLCSDLQSRSPHSAGREATGVDQFDEIFVRAIKS